MPVTAQRLTAERAPAWLGVLRLHRQVHGHPQAAERRGLSSTDPPAPSAMRCTIASPSPVDPPWLCPRPR